MKNILIWLFLGAYFSCANPLGFLPFCATKPLTLPETRLRIVWKDTGKPVEWVLVDYLCLQEKSARERRNASIRGESGSARVCEFSRYIHAEDGWVTIEGVNGIQMDHYEITITPAGCRHAIFENMKDGRTQYFKLSYPDDREFGNPYFDETRFPLIASLPESQRVLKARLANSLNRPSGSMEPSYNYCRYVLAEYEIIQKTWPEMASLQMFSHHHNPKDSHYKGNYFGTVYSWLFEIDGMLVKLPESAKRRNPKYVPMTEAEKKDIYDRFKTLFCTDLMEKCKQWDLQCIPKEMAEQPLFKSLHCETFWGKEAKPCEKVD